MNNIDKDMTINEAIKVFPSVLAVFKAFGIDSCCGGANTLAEACEEKGINITDFLKALSEAAGRRRA